MSQKVSYKIEFLGLNEEVSNLKKLESQLNSIGNKTANLGNLGGKINGGAGGNTIIAPIGGGVGKGTAAASAEGAAFGSAIGNKLGTSPFVKSINKLEQMAKIGFRQFSLNMPVPSELEKQRNLQKYKEDISITIRKGSEGKIIDIDRKVTALAHELPVLNAQSKVPLGPSNISDWRMVLHQLKTGLVAKEGSIGNILGSAGGGKGGVGGGIRGLLAEGAGSFGKLIGGFSVLGAAAIAVGVGLFALKKTIDIVMAGIKIGAEAFQRAAKTGLNVSRYSQIASAFNAIGMEAPDLSILHGQFGKTEERRMEVPDSDVILGAARAGQLGEMQQILNMSEEFKAAMEDGESSARQMGEASGALQEASQAGAAVSREWHTLLAQLATLVSPIVRLVEFFVKEILQVFNIIIEYLIRFVKWFVGPALASILFPSERNNTQQVGKINSGNNNTAWEKIGFIYSSGAKTTNDHIRSIADSTSKALPILNKIANSISPDNNSFQHQLYTHPQQFLAT